MPDLAPSLKQIIDMSDTPETRNKDFSESEKKALSDLTSITNRPDLFQQAFQQLEQQDGRFKGKGQEFQNILRSSLQGIEVQKNEDREALLYNTNAKLRELRMQVEGKSPVVGKSEFGETVPDKKKMLENKKKVDDLGVSQEVIKKYESQGMVLEQNGKYLRAVPAKPEGGDFLSRIDGTTLIAGLAAAGFSLSAISSMSGNGNSQAVMLAMGALASGNYIRNQLSDNPPDKPEDVIEIAKKHNVDESYIKNVLGDFDSYNTHYGRSLEGVTADLHKDIVKLNKSLFDVVNPNHLHGALQGQKFPLGTEVSYEQKIQWFHNFFRENNAERGSAFTSMLESYKEILQGEDGKKSSGILDNVYHSLVYLDQKGVHNDARKSAFIAMSKHFDSKIKDVFNNMTNF